MAKTYVLDRVAADLARGFTHPAIQRLSSLVAAYPNDLDLRRRLAAVHRRVGNRIQAGRWDYLTIGANAHDTRAFERAFPSAITRLRAVRWPHRAGHAATAYARNRLATLVAAAEAERPTTGPTTPPATATATAPPPAASSGAARSRTPGGWGREHLLAAQRLVGTALALVQDQWRRIGRSWDLAITGLVAGAVATSALVVVGLVTVVQWAVQ